MLEDKLLEMKVTLFGLIGIGLGIGLAALLG
jgi:hypothetical protein